MDKYLLKRSEIENLSGVEKTHFLNQNAKRTNKSLGDMTGLKAIGFHIIEVPPGAESTEFHRHLHEEECTYILSGTGVVQIGEEVHAIGPGDFIGYRAQGEAHTMRNTGEVPLKCIVVGERRPFDIGEYPQQGKRLFRAEGQPWNLVDIKDVEYPKGGKK